MAQKKNPSARGDVTGRQKAQAAKEATKEQQEAAKRMAMATAVEAEKKKEVVDLSGNTPEVVESNEPQELDGTPVDVSEPDETVEQVVAKAAPHPSSGSVAAVVEQGVQVAEKTKLKVKALYDIEDATVGYGTSFTLEEGRRYILPRHVAEHFAEKELVEIIG